MKFFVANATHQIQSVNYRLSVDPKAGFSTQNIDIGRQQMIGHPNLDKEQIERIFNQLALYGLRMARDLDWDRDTKVPLIGSIDEPVPFELIMKAVEFNDGVMNKQGKKLREEAAIATSHGMRNYSPQAADNVALSVEEEKPGTMDHGGKQGIAEGYRMDREFGRS
jgi:hypothetical protein